MTRLSLVRVTARDLASEALVGLLLAPLALLVLGAGVLVGLGAW